MLTRTTLGLLGRDHFNRADGTLGAEWDIVVGAGAWSIEGQAAKVVGANEHRRARLNTVAARMAMVVQARIKNTSPDINSAPGLLARWDEAGGHRYLATFSHNNGRKEFQFHRLTGGVETPLAGVAFAWTTNGFNTMKLLIENGLQVGWADGAERFRLNDAALDAVLGNAGLFNWSGGNFVSYYDDFIVCADNAVVVTGLPAGYKVRVGSLVAAEVGGTATLDLAGTTLPAALLEVLDGSDNVVDTYTGEVWGGDEFLFDPMLTRPVSGLIFRETFDDIAVGSLPSGWTQVNADASPTFSVQAAPVGMSGRALRAVLYSGVGQSAYVRDDTSGIADGVIQAKVMAQRTGHYNIQPSLNARFADNANHLYGRAEHFSSDGGAALTEVSAGTSVSAKHRVILTLGTAYRLILRVVGNQGGVWIRNPDGTLKASVSKELTRLAAGKWGVRWVGDSTNSIWWDDVALYRDSTIKVQGLPAGSKVRIGFLEAVENAGEAMLDFTGLYMDVSTLEVLDAGGNVLASFTFPGGIWGGDEFIFTTSGVPAKPVLTAGVVGPFSVQVLGSAFVDPDGDPHLASQWQLDRIGGDFSVPIHDSGAVSGAELLAYTFHGLTRATPYIARGRYRDADGWSEWSDPLAIATVDTWQLCRVRPATDWDPCQRVTPAVKPWAHYRLDELEVTDIPYDASGNERHGAGYHASLVQLGAPGYDGGRAVRLPGTLQLASPAIDIRNVLHDGVGGWAGGGFEDTPPAIHALSSDFGGKGFSVEFWFYAEEETALPTGHGDNYGSRVIWFAQHGGPVESTRNVYAGLGFIAGTNGFVCYGHAGAYIYNGTMLQADLGTGWHHALVITAPAPPKKLCSRLFIDGFYGAEHPARTSYEEVDWTTTPASWTTGRKHIIFLHGFAGSNNPALRGSSFRGRIDDIRIYDHAIDPSAPRDVWVPCGPRPATAWTRGC